MNVLQNAAALPSLSSGFPCRGKRGKKKNDEDRIVANVGLMLWLRVICRLFRKACTRGVRVKHSQCSVTAHRRGSDREDGGIDGCL